MSRPDVDPPTETENAAQPEGALFDSYRSVRDPTIMIFVKAGNAAPFRFKAGGWDLERSSIVLGPAVTDRIIERRFFMCRVKEGGSGGAELIDFPALDPSPTGTDNL